jgi:CRISPR-associated protein Csy1
MENDFSKMISRHIEVKKNDAIKKFESAAGKKRKDATNSHELAALESDLEEKRSGLEVKYNPANWLTDAAGRAKKRQLATHALKYTHPNAKGNSFYAPGGGVQEGFVTTSCLNHPAIDFVGDASASDVSVFLQLSQNGKTLIEYLQKGDTSPLKPFAADAAQLEEWVSGFRGVLSIGQPVSHTLSKQVYFPVCGKQYHLLSPLSSSSLFQATYDRIRVSHLFSEKAKDARKAKREGKFCENMVVDFPDTLILSFGGTKPQNISQLNSGRKGEAVLLSCAPPSWKKPKRPPIKARNVFTKNNFGYQVRRDVFELRNFLEKQSRKEGSNVRIRRKRAAMVDKIIDQLLQYGAEIQSLREHAGWSASAECKLKPAQKLWLDPHRADTDELFKQEREKNDWQETVADQFALWFNGQIGINKKITPGDHEHKVWQGLVETKLKMFKQDFREFV